MHSYSVDDRQRHKVSYFIAIFAILAAWLLQMFLVEVMQIRITLSYFIVSPSVMIIFAASFSVFDRFLWKHPLLWRLRIVATPDFNGVWGGSISSSKDNFSKEFPATLSIAQTWTRISIVLETADTKSYSTMAFIRANNPHEVMLTHSYIAKPKPHISKGIEMHHGTSELT